ncbi:MAG: hypothetical protein GEV12_06420 [Micromonosporaceae bacterium]|nr:hypothetical protein [Micromonosporaceae bacterium]
MTGQKTTTPVRRGWPDWVGYAAAGWAAGYAVLALVWTVTGRGYPFGPGDPDSIGPLRNLPASIGAPLFASGLVATAVAALVMTGRARPAPPLRHALAGLGWLVAGVLLVVVPEVRVLALVGYAPMLILGAPFGWPPEVDYSEIFTWPLLNQAIAIAGGFLVAGTVLAWLRRTRGGCEACGRPGSARPDRWARAAVAVAMAVPLLYAVTRFAWLVGIPLTITDEFLAELHDSGAVWAGAGLGAFAVVGAVLTLGLVQRWGERFPRWMVGLAGRRVPVSLAVVPAALVSVLVTSAGVGFLSHPDLFERLAVGEWILLPQLFWPVWGVALGAAIIAYQQRRRGRCPRCGRG